MKKLILLCCFFFINDELYSQSLIENMNAYSPPSPEAASLVSQSGQYSVVQYSGKLNYSAPITQVEFGGLMIDLGIKYSTSGFKVQDIAGSLGLGWNANFGGVITRYVEGLPDEEENGYCGANRIGEKNYQALNNEYLEKLSNADWDSQPDKFYFSFLGFSGTLMLDPDGVPVLNSSTSGLKVEYSPYSRINGRANGGLEQWILRDQAGNQYFFGAEFVERTSSTTHGEVKDVSKSFISSWFIKKIITKNNRTILFNYTAGPSTSYTYYVNVYRKYTFSGGCTYSGPIEKSWNENVDISIEAPLYLSQIKMEGGETVVNFSYNINRIDLENAKALTDIEVLFNNKVKRTYLLQYDYFIATDGTNTKRLKNKSISEKSSAGNLKKLFTFFYDESAVLPARNSIKTDYWGYYNNNSGGSDIEGYLDASKQPYFNNTKACVLSSVNYSTGGSIHFEYEQNDYGEGNSNIYAGGIRVKRKFERASRNVQDQNVINEEYIYTDPRTLLSSGQLYVKQQNRQLIADNIIPYSLGGTAWYCIFENIYKYSVPLISLFDLNETSVGYSVVSIKKLNGTTRYRFTNFSDKQDEFEQKIYNTTSKTEQINEMPGGNLIPQFLGTSYSFARGKLKSEELFDILGHKVKHSNYEYEYTTQSAPVIGLKAYTYRIFGTSKLYYFGRSNFFNQDFRLIRKIDTTYKAGKSTLVAKEEYTYTTYANNLISTRSLITLGGKVLTERFKYPFDDLGNSTFSEMCNINRISDVIEKTKYNNNVIIEKEFKNFVKMPSGLIAPASVEKQIGNGPKKIKMLFNYYDTYGNLLESQIPNGIKESYFWSYDGNFLLAKVLGSSYSEAKQFVDLNMLAVADNYTDLQINAELNKLRIGLPSSQVTTYTHNALIGITSQTDPKGKATFYEYDEFGRLKIIKNHDQDLVKTYDYHINYLYNSKTIVQPFTKTNCPAGLTPETIDYILPEGTYNSFISQIDADNKAIADVNLNGQNFANQNGRCLQTVTVKNDGSTHIQGFISLMDDDNVSSTFPLGDTQNTKTLLLEPGRYRIKMTLIDPTKSVLLNINGNFKVVNTEWRDEIQLSGSLNILAYGSYFGNIGMTQVFVKNNCPIGQIGSRVSYVVPVDKYYSGSSQTDANAKAQAEIDLNGQNNANSSGTCTVPGVSLTNSDWVNGSKVYIIFKQGNVVKKTIQFPDFLSTTVDSTLPIGMYSMQLLTTKPNTAIKAMLNNSEIKTGSTITFSNVSVGSGMVYIELLEP